MSSLQEQFNSKSTTEFLPRLKMTDLVISTPYPVLRFRRVEIKNTLFGAKGVASTSSILAEIDFLKEIEEGKGKVGQLFLPRRFNAVLTEEEVEKYNKNPNGKIVFEGVGKTREYIIKFIQE